MLLIDLYLNGKDGKSFPKNPILMNLCFILDIDLKELFYIKYKK